MRKIAFLFTLLVTALVCLLPAAPAQAQAPRTFISAAGSDSNNCTNVATPCRHLAAAYAATAANGEIYVLDPANYGSLTITGPVSIEGHGWASIAPVSGGNAITINANPGDAINIIGVVLDGTALANTNGIVFNSGGSLKVADSVVRNFSGTARTGNGILIQPTTGTLAFSITNTTASNNGNSGIAYYPQGGSPSANGVIGRVVADANGIGIAVNPQFATGGSIVLAVSDSIASNNSTDGIFAGFGAATLKVSIDNVTASGNGSGIYAYDPANVLLGRSVITGNVTGVTNVTTSPTFYTYKDNRINLNGTDISGNAPSTTFILQ